MVAPAQTIAYNLRMNGEIQPRSLASEPAEDRETYLIGLFKRRLDYLFQNYRFAVAHSNRALGFNESLETGARVLNPRARRRPPRRRVDPVIELAINLEALKLARARDPEATGPEPQDVRAASECVVARVHKRRGRPANQILAYHVHAAMALHHQTTGNPLSASMTRNSVYDPNLSACGEALLTAFRQIDPRITRTTIVDIIRAGHLSGIVDGKTFEDFFPFFGGRIDPQTGFPIPGPGFRLEAFERLAPIYSS